MPSWRRDRTPGRFDPIEVMLDGRRLAIGFDSDMGLLVKPEASYLEHEGVRDLFEAVIEARRASAEVGAEFAVLLIPTKTRVLFDFIADRENLERFFTQQMAVLKGVPRRDLERNYPERRDALAGVIGRFLNGAGIEFLDLTLPLVEETRRGGRPLYFPLDAHWNAEGHRFAGETLARWIAERGLLPER